MTKNTKPKKRLIDGNHQLLSIKEVMDTILQESEGLTSEVKQSIISTRNTVWQAFIKEQEKGMAQ